MSLCGCSDKQPDESQKPEALKNKDGNYNILFILNDQEKYMAEFPTGTDYKGREFLREIGMTFQSDMDRDLPTLGDLLRKAGYYTAYKGKWHLSKNDTSLEEYGFSDWQTGMVPFRKDTKRTLPLQEKPLIGCNPSGNGRTATGSRFSLP